MHILLDGLQNAHVELPHGDGGQVCVAEQAVDDLQQRLLHAREPLLQQLRGYSESQGKAGATGGARVPRTVMVSCFPTRGETVLSGPEEMETLSRAVRVQT